MSFKEDYARYKSYGHPPWVCFSNSMPMWWFIIAGVVAGGIFGFAL